MPADPSRSLAEQAMRALCRPPVDAPGRRAPGADGAEILAHAVVDDLGALLEITVRSKTIGLLAEHVQRTPIDGLDRATARFLASTLRLNRHKIGLHRDAAVSVTSALRSAGVASAVVGGMSVEYSLYGGRGARQCSDLDLVVAPQDRGAAERVLHTEGYRAPPGAGAWTRPCDDAVVPLLVIDLACSLPHAATGGEVSAVLGRRIEISVPRYDDARTTDRLPVLCRGDALDHTLARLGAARRAGGSDAAGAQVAGPSAGPRWALLGDAIRQAHQGAPGAPQDETVRAGWSVLRDVWPTLPETPARVGGDHGGPR